MLKYPLLWGKNPISVDQSCCVNLVHSSQGKLQKVTTDCSICIHRYLKEDLNYIVLNPNLIVFVYTRFLRLGVIEQTWRDYFKWNCIIGF